MLAGHQDTDEGFGLVELIIAMFLLALITIALIPALYNGIIYSSQQATTATATRELNALVETARQTHQCGASGAPSGSLSAVSSSQTFRDGANQKFTTSGTFDCTTAPARLTLVATDVDGKQIVTINALVYLQ
ncbi:hypothetical protein RS86_01085 [Microbacterium azadirachtae]|uniref:Prepilin-type N-terminal cleavage/methylation domain-containing protein n=2 Tax=Microbacterium azadirachtae TaxID=582680 RepID=A0A0F0LMD1_9MICO|nr:hypothetical protein RS86_01085 [Microbacterium azadirachtae]